MRCGGFTKKILTKIILLPCNLQKKLHCGSRYLDVYTRSYLVFVKGKKSIVANLQLSLGYTLPIAFMYVLLLASLKYPFSEFQKNLYWSIQSSINILKNLISFYLL